MSVSDSAAAAPYVYVSSAFDALYPGTVGFPEPDCAATAADALRDQAGAGIEFIAELYGSLGYGKAFSPSIFAADTAFTRLLWPLYGDLAIKQAAPAVLVRLDDAMSFGSVLFAGPGDGGNRSVVYETHRPNDRAATQVPAYPLPRAYQGESITTDADLLFLASAGSFNYGHFLVDDLPRVVALHVMRERGAGRVGVAMVSHGEPIDANRAAAIRMVAGDDVEVVWLLPGHGYRHRSLYYATPVSYHPNSKHPPALDHIVDVMNAHAGDTSEYGERLYVARDPSHGRRLLNEAAVIDALTPLGFRVIRPETLSVADQTRAFRDARLIVGQMGAAMTNTVFASSEARLLYLSPEGWIETFYWDLAVARGQQYRVLYGTAVDPTPNAHANDFTIDVATLLDTPLLHPA